MGKEVNVLRVSMVCLVLVAVLLLLAVVALGVGSAGYSLQQIIQALFYDESGPVRVVVYNLRLPRLIMAVEVPKSNLATEILSSDGKVLGTFFVQNRSYVQYDD